MAERLTTRSISSEKSQSPFKLEKYKDKEWQNWGVLRTFKSTPHQKQGSKYIESAQTTPGTDFILKN